jgi:metal-responsive CopG/Arc/MetJ family transcriptional regulator
MVKTRISLTIDPKILKELDKELGKASKKSRSLYIERCIGEKLKNEARDNE